MFVCGHVEPDDASSRCLANTRSRNAGNARIQFDSVHVVSVGALDSCIHLEGFSVEMETRLASSTPLDRVQHDLVCDSRRSARLGASPSCPADHSARELRDMDHVEIAAQPHGNGCRRDDSGPKTFERQRCEKANAVDLGKRVQLHSVGDCRTVDDSSERRRRRWKQEGVLCE